MIRPNEHSSQNSRKVVNKVARKKINKKNNFKSENSKKQGTSLKIFWKTITSERAVQIYGIILMSFAIILLLASCSYFFTRNNNSESNLIGPFGNYLAKGFVDYTFGIFAIGFCPLFFIFGFKLTFGKTLLPIVKTIFNALLCMAWLSLVFGYIFTENSLYNYISGAFGINITKILITELGKFGTFILLLVFLATILILCFNISFKRNISSNKSIVSKDNDSDSETSEPKSSFFKSVFSKNKSNQQVPEKTNCNSEEQPHIIIDKRTVDTDIDFADIVIPSPSEKDTDNHDLPPIIIETKPKNSIHIEDITSSHTTYDNPLTTTMNIDDKEIQKDESTFQNIEEQTKTNNTIEFINNLPTDTTPEQKNDSDSVPFEITDNSTSESETQNIIENQENLTDSECLHNYQTLEKYNPRDELSHYQFPTIDLLNDYQTAVISMEDKKEELTANKERIEKVLRGFGVEISKIQATLGPTVTLYEIIPAEGVRITKIKNLEDDIALSLAALGIRIIAPIPGKGTIGIEVPNSNPDIVPMRAIITSDKFKNNKYDLPIGLGKTISNEVFVADLAKMPHLLMAGATGQGKSVGLNAVMTSLLYKKHPSELKFILVDPKKVELTLYSLIEKYYLAKLPDAEDAIITDTKKVVRTLNSLCIEMDNRYDLLKQAQVRNIKEYNAKFCNRKLSPAKGHRFLPYIVLIIDEFADLIMTAGREVETPIARLAQLARAIGIHLIIATQRPSVNIITGLIKANFPARLAFRVTSKIDSRTILDMGGADQLIGRGDMLLSTGNELTRIQCAFVDTPEVESICHYISEQQSFTNAFLLPEYTGEESEMSDNSGGFDDDIDPKLIEAAELIVQIQQGSTSIIQRRLKLGYNRAGRIMDQLEDIGIVGPSQGSKAREMRIKTMEDLNLLLKNKGLL